MTTKQTIIAAVMLIVICACGVWLKNGCDRSVPPPDSMWTRPQTLIDIDTLEVKTLPLAEWGEPDKSGRYKHRATGKYTMTLAMHCPHCDELVPPIQYKDIARVQEERDGWVCPHCKGKGF